MKSLLSAFVLLSRIISNDVQGFMHFLQPAVNVVQPLRVISFDDNLSFFFFFLNKLKHHRSLSDSKSS